MPSFSNSVLRLFQRLFDSNKNKPQLGIKTVLDGNTAVAVIETCIAETAGLGTSADAASYAWQVEQQQRQRNCLDKDLSSHDAESARGALAAAIGLSMSGTRTTTFLSSPDLMTVQDLLVMAVGRQLPLVVHLTNRTLAGHAGALGSGHKAYHTSADSGFFVLHARNVQEVIDFSLIARRVTELTLIPGLVAMDAEQTALSVQEVHLPTLDFIQEFVGQSNEEIETPTPAQKLLFGETRCRLPCWHDLDHPVMHGAVQGPESWAYGAVSKHPYVTHHLESILAEAFETFTQLSKLPIAAISDYQTKDAKIVLVAQGAVVETLEAVADYLRKHKGLKIGVLGIQSFRPFPGAVIAQALARKSIVAVLERVDTPLAVDPPLMRHIRASLERALENGRLNKSIHLNYPLLKEQQLPRFRPVVYGLGGMPVRANDLIALCENVVTSGQGRVFLGFDFAKVSSLYPKRQVLLDHLRRYYPNITQLGLRSQQKSPDLRPQKSLTIAVHQVSKQSGLNVEISSLIQNLQSGFIRSRPGLFQERWLTGWTDLFTYSPTKLRDPGDDLPINVLILTAPTKVIQSPISELIPKGVLLAVCQADNDETLWKNLSPKLQADIQAKQVQFYHVNFSNNSQSLILGALFRILLNTELLKQKERKIISGYEASLKNLPETEQAVSQFKQGMKMVKLVDYQSFSVSKDEAVWNDEAPMAVRHLAHDAPTYDSLPRFWDQIGVLYRNGETHEMIPDPYMATGIVPSLSSTFRDLTQAREVLPAFEPSNCTGCGKCWTRCPDSALNAIILKPNDLLEAGIRLTNESSLRMIVGKLADGIYSLSRDQKVQFNTFGDMIQAAFAGLKDKLPLKDERKTAVVKALIALSQKIGHLLVARTEPFFYEAERYQHKTGALLSIVINPNACKACALCIESCESNALFPSTQTSNIIEQAHTRWHLWEQLPDTSGEIIQKSGQNPILGKLPAILLSRYCQLAIAGGDNAEAGSGEKLAVRYVLAITEFQQQPEVNATIKEVAKIQYQLNAIIRSTLSNALPTNDLDALEAGLNAVSSNQTPLTELTQKIETKQNLIDATTLSRIVKITQALNKLHQQLSQGVQGLGRARLSLAIAPGTLTEWAGSWPTNPFQMPVAIDMTGETVHLAAGLLEGQLRKTIESIKLLRQARLELENPEAAKRQVDVGVITWQDLTKEEQSMCPPLLLIGNEEVLHSKGFASINHLLAGNLPIKIIILTDLDLNLGTKQVAGQPMAVAKQARFNPGLLALSQRNSYVVQTSIAQPNHFFASVNAALEFSGSALIYAHTPSPDRHGFETYQTLAQADWAVKSRVFPLFTYDPEKSGVFGNRISLEGNDCIEDLWNPIADKYITPIDWLVTETRFKPYFSPLTDEDSTPIEISEYLKLTVKLRHKKTPFILVKNFEEETRLKIALPLIAICDECAQTWQMLQELAGIITPFTTDVEAKLKSQLAENHQAELDSLKQDYENQIKNLRSKLETEMAVRVKKQLMVLAGYEE